MSDDEEYTCPNCKKVYPVMPKWCPCEPFPMAEPYSVYYLLELFADSELEEYFAGGYPSITTLMAGEKNPFKTVSLVAQNAGWGMDFIELLEPGAEPKEPETLQEWLEHYLRSREARPNPNGSATGLVLLKESFRPGVETLDYLGWDVVDLEREEYDKLLALAGIGSCGI